MLIRKRLDAWLNEEVDLMMIEDSNLGYDDHLEINDPERMTRSIITRREVLTTKFNTFKIHFDSFSIKADTWFQNHLSLIKCFSVGFGIFLLHRFFFA